VSAPVTEDPRLRALGRLLVRGGAAEWELDLRGLDRLHALASIDRMVERGRFGEPKSVDILLDPATAESGETLFQPVGRHLLDLLRRGLLARLAPLSAPRAGFHVALPGRKEREPGTAPPPA